MKIELEKVHVNHEHVKDVHIVSPLNSDMLVTFWWHYENRKKNCRLDTGIAKHYVDISSSDQTINPFPLCFRLHLQGFPAQSPVVYRQ